MGRHQQHESRGRREKGAEPGQEPEAQGEGDQMVGGEGEHEADEGHPRPQPAQAHAGFHQQRIDHERPGQGVEVGARALSGPPGSQGEKGEGQGVGEPGRHPHRGRQGAGVRQGPDQVARRRGPGPCARSGEFPRENRCPTLAEPRPGPRRPLSPSTAEGSPFLPEAGTTRWWMPRSGRGATAGRCSAFLDPFEPGCEVPMGSLMPTPAKTPPRPCLPRPRASRVRLDRARGSSRPAPRARAR